MIKMIQRAQTKMFAFIYLFAFILSWNIFKPQLKINANKKISIGG